MDSLLPPILAVYRKEGVAEAITHSCAFLLISYLSILILAENITSRRKRAWILTMVASFIVFAGSLPAVYSFMVKSQFNLAIHPTQDGDFDMFLCCFFISYLVMDLVIGMIHYRDQIYFLSGWVHHFGYIVLVTHLINKNLTTSFCMMGVMEVPTFALSLGHLWKPLRNDMVFGALFFSTRIFYHGIMVWLFYHHYPVEGPWWLVVAGVYPLHCYWFRSWLRQQKKLRKRGQELAEEAIKSEQISD